MMEMLFEAKSPLLDRLQKTSHCFITYHLGRRYDWTWLGVAVVWKRRCYHAFEEETGSIIPKYTTTIRNCGHIPSTLLFQPCIRFHCKDTVPTFFETPASPWIMTASDVILTYTLCKFNLYTKGTNSVKSHNPNLNYYIELENIYFSYMRTGAKRRYGIVFSYYL